MTEMELAERCKLGDNQARKELYERYAGRMLGICLRYAGDRDTAEDLLHDGFLRAFRYFDKFNWRGEGSLRAWMERLMANVALQYLRDKNVLSQAQPIDEVRELSDDEPDADDIERVPEEVLMKFIGELPTGYRTVLNLYIFEEKSHREIARLLGINEKSSASQFFRAKHLLAKRIKEWIACNE
ncbi:MAG: sigma-70 family RNA polymerase sigma factor [Mediterranea sp.]|jgi:RNA polymerase sigma-70 factor (ECF subfamily)|nr:sigma-70 family RNA polymerase sigma factor [Mediterranea sp.]